MIRLYFIIYILATYAMPAQAHELQPGYLELRLAAPDEYTVTWKVPAIKGQPMPIVAILPENCTPRHPEQLVWDGSAYIARWTVACPGGLEGGMITIEGLDNTSTDVLVRYDHADGRNATRRLTPNSAGFQVPKEPNKNEVIRTYMSLGFEHILSGLDHLLFVLALLLLVRGSYRIFATITAFTIAHSITLAVATLGLWTLDGPPVEATIALSIVFVAAEIRHSQMGKVGLTERFPWVVAFSFGLLHGFGFAGALSELGLPVKSIPLALLLFNVGVELGQLAFVAAVLLLIGGSSWIFRRQNIAAPSWARTVPPYAIGTISTFWFLQRITTFF
jgi:hydrogenase/urease accessory protein HupE